MSTSQISQVDLKTEEPPATRILTRRASRSASTHATQQASNTNGKSMKDPAETSPSSNPETNDDNSHTLYDAKEEEEEKSYAKQNVAELSGRKQDQEEGNQQVKREENNGDNGNDNNEEEDEDEEEEEEEESNPGRRSPAAESNDGTSASESVHASSNGEPVRVTRSQSVDDATSGSRKRARDSAVPASASPAPSSPPATNARPTKKRRARATALARARNGVSTSNDDSSTTERETRTTSQRMSKEAREAKKAQRDAEIREKMAELDKLEQAVVDRSHPEYLKLVQEIENKHAERVKKAQSELHYSELNFKNTFDQVCKAAFDHFQLQKQGVRRQMMQQLQQQISKLEQEHYSLHVESSLDEQHVSAWVPRQRPSRLDSVVIPVAEEEADGDLANMRLAAASMATHSGDINNHKQPSTTTTTTTPTITTTTPATATANHTHHSSSSASSSYQRTSPPLDMLASLADNRPHLRAPLLTQNHSPSSPKPIVN